VKLVVMEDHLWRRNSLDRGPDAVQARIRIDGRPHTVCRVLSPNRVS
jgi:hypothetical protein